MTEEMFKRIADIVTLAVGIGFTISGIAALSGYAIGRAMDMFNDILSNR